MFDVAVFDFGGEFCSEVVGLDDGAADAGYQKVVAEHSGYGDEQGDDGCEECAGDAGCHGGDVCSAGYGDSSEGLHDTPDGTEEANEGGAADGHGEDVHVGFELEGGLAYGAFHGGGDGSHLCTGDFWGAFEAGFEGFVNFGGAEHLEAEFGGSGFVDFVEGGAVEGEVLLVDTEGFAVAAEERGEVAGLVPGKPELAHFCDHDGPTENGAYEEDGDDYFSFKS